MLVPLRFNTDLRPFSTTKSTLLRNKLQETTAPAAAEIDHSLSLLRTLTLPNWETFNINLLYKVQLLFFPWRYSPNLGLGLPP
jgi:hypothetical protein